MAGSNVMLEYTIWKSCLRIDLVQNLNDINISKATGYKHYDHGSYQRPLNLATADC